MLFLIPMLLPFLLFYKWGGFTVIHSHKIIFNISNITGVLTVIGFWFLPFTLQKMKCIKLKLFIFMGILSFILGIFYKPVWSQYFNLGSFTGFTFHAIEVSSKLNEFIPWLITIILTFSGLSCLVLIFRDVTEDYKKIFCLIILFFLLIYSFHILIGERHLIHLLVLIFALTLTKLNTRISLIWFISMIFIGTIYFFYWFY